MENARTPHTNPTPGPWNATFSHGPEAEQFNTPRSVYAGHVPIAQIAGQAPGGPSEWAANARLIAAAPDLLAACRAVRRRLLPYDGDALTESRREELDAMLKQAIAKAEGGDV